MTPAVRYTIHLQQPVLSWQVAVRLSHPIERPRAYLMTVHGYDPGEEFVPVAGRGWSRSEQLDADFCYLPTGSAGELLPLPPLQHEDGVTRLELVVRQFVDPPAPPSEAVSTLCFLDLDQADVRAPRVVTTYTPEAVDV